MAGPATGRRSGFTLIELLVVIAIIAILAAILFPVFQGARERGKMGQCVSNLRQIGICLQSYIADWNDRYPPSRFRADNSGEAPVQKPHPHWRTWKEAIWPLVKNKQVWICASNEAYRSKYGPWKGMDETGLFPISYGYNSAVFEQNHSPKGTMMAELDRPSRIIYMLETRYHAPDLGPWCLVYNGWRYSEGKGFVQSHVGKKANWLFCDMHAQSLSVVQTCTPHSLWGINIRGKGLAKDWSQQAWWDAIVQENRMAPEYY